MNGTHLLCPHLSCSHLSCSVLTCPHLCRCCVRSMTMDLLGQLQCPVCRCAVDGDSPPPNVSLARIIETLQVKTPVLRLTVKHCVAKSISF